MIEAKLLSVWDGLVESAALIALVIVALCVMVQALTLGDLPRHLGLILGAMILLIMLPPIILSLWNAMSFWQHLGIGSASVGVLIFVVKLRRAPASKRPR